MKINVKDYFKEGCNNGNIESLYITEDGTILEASQLCTVHLFHEILATYKRVGIECKYTSHTEDVWSDSSYELLETRCNVKTYIIPNTFEFSK